MHSLLLRLAALSALPVSVLCAADFHFRAGDETATSTPIRVRIDQNNTGRAPLSIDGVMFSRGIGTHAPSTTFVRLDGKASRFTAKVGVDDAAGAPGSVEFLVFGDARLLWRSGLVAAGSPAMPVSVPLSGVRLLQLVVTVGSDTNAKDFANWSDAAIAYEGSAPRPVSRSALGAEPVSISLATLPFERFENHPGKFAIGLSLREPLPPRLNGTAAPAAVVIHSGYRMVIDTQGKASIFQARIGVHDNPSNRGSVRFQFIGDGRLLLETGVVRADEAPADIDLNLTDVKEFVIAVDDGGDGELFDHAVIADAVFTVRDASPVIRHVQKR